jgi:hypothetical protein
VQSCCLMMFEGAFTHSHCGSCVGIQNGSEKSLLK